MPISASALGLTSTSGSIRPADVSLLQGAVQQVAGSRAYQDNIGVVLPFIGGTPAVSIDNTPFCAQFSAVLAAAGWTLSSQTYATATLVAPLGWDFGSFLRLAGVIQGLAFEYYDPTHEDPPSGYDGPYPIIPVPVSAGQDPESQLAIYITGSTGLNASILDSQTILLTAKFPGILYNGIQVAGSGSVTIGSGYTSGGGYLWSTGGARGNSATMTLRVSTGPVYESPRPPFIGPGWAAGAAYLELTVQGTTVGWTLARGTWFAHASTYSFYLHCYNPNAVGDIFSGNSHFWGCLPMIPGSGTGWSPVDAPVGGTPLGTAAFFTYLSGTGEGQMFGAPTHVWAPNYYAATGGLGWWAIAGFHNENQHAYPITDQKFGDLIQTALVMMQQTGTQMRICGYVGDAFVVNRSVPLLFQTQKDGLIYVCLAGQARPVGALFQLLGNAVYSVNTSAPAGQQISTSNPFYGATVKLGGASLDWHETASILTIASGLTPEQSWVGKYILYPGSGAGDATGLALQFANGGQAGTLHRVVSILGSNQVQLSGWFTPNNANQLAQYKSLYTDATLLPFAVGPF